MPLNPADEADLRELARHWEAYDFSVCEDAWSARPRQERGALLTADSAAELQDLVRADYRSRHSARRQEPPLGDRMST
jgi:hypothetical protein